MTIAEVSKKYGLSPDTLRYYERIGLIPDVHRTSGGIRDYSEADCRWIELAKCKRGAGVQIEALVRYVSLFREGEQTAGERRDILVEQRARLMERIADMQSALEQLNYKIERYDLELRPAENDIPPC